MNNTNRTKFRKPWSGSQNACNKKVQSCTLCSWVVGLTNALIVPHIRMIMKSMGIAYSYHSMPLRADQLAVSVLPLLSLPLLLLPPVP